MSELISVFGNYTPWCDVAVIAICSVIIILLRLSYVNHTQAYHIFMFIIASLIVAAIVNITYHILLILNPPGFYNLIYAFRILYHALLLNEFNLFVLYTVVVSKVEHKRARAAAIVSTILFLSSVFTDAYLTFTGNGFQIISRDVVAQRTNVFMIAYVLYILLLLVIMVHEASNLVFSRVMSGFYWTMALAVAIRIAQIPFNQTSLTTITFLFPVIAMLYIMHSNPYNVALGTVSGRALKGMVKSMHERKTEFVFMSLLLTEFNEEGKELPEKVSALVRQFSVEYFTDCVVFQINTGHLILIASKKRNPNYEDRIRVILRNFQKCYNQMRHSYKIIIGESVEEISRRNEYASLVLSIQKRIPENTIYRVTPDDIDRFIKNEYVLQELTDIYKKHDLEDPRVLAFCQPVYNLKTGEFDTAESLMRLKLKDIGIVYPDQFIPLAESHDYIHVLTEIILHKTCKEIRRLLDEGYMLTRISVNVSAPELKSENFCSDINNIIYSSCIPYEKIAIELTESRSEADFMIMKEKIDELSSEGIRFYLDDFGTGYSNMERIMELPFDIIKFDRSLVIESGKDLRSEKIIGNLAHMFQDMDYSLLYEGVENLTDEERCRDMSASYLQGFKYSKPIPIENLRKFLSRAV